MKTFTPTTVTTRLPNSTGVRPVWMGSTGGPNSGFEQLRQRNGTKLSAKSDLQMQAIRKDMEAKMLAARALMGAVADIDYSRLSPRFQKRLGVCHG